MEEAFIEEPSWSIDAAVLLETISDYQGGLFHGKGKALFVTGVIYEGDFDNGFMHGKGKITFPGKVTYEGDMRENCITGKGKYTWENGVIYEGDVVNGFRHGEGSLLVPNGPNYEGHWKHGEMDGKGTLWFDPNRSVVYEGDFVRNIREGYGKMMYATGSEYDGEWKNGLRDGTGRMCWPSRREEYQGMWSNGLPHGKGEYIWKGAVGEKGINRYVGEFRDGKKHGKGVFYYADGSVFEGEWEEDLKNGKGVLTQASGSQTIGVFESDKLVESSPGGPLDTMSSTMLSSSLKSSGRTTSQLTTAQRSRAPTGSQVSNLQLFLDDLIVGGSSECDSMTADVLLPIRNEIVRVISREYQFMRKLYRTYSCATLRKDIREMGTLSMTEFWMFVRDLGLPLSLSHLDRIYAKTLKHSSTLKSRILERFKSTAGRIQKNELGRVRIDLHDPHNEMEFRDFLEALVRVANALEPITTEPVSVVFGRFVGEKLKPSEEMLLSPKVHSSEDVHVLMHDYLEELRQLFSKCSSAIEDIDMLKDIMQRTAEEIETAIKISEQEKVHHDDDPGQDGGIKSAHGDSDKGNIEHGEMVEGGQAEDMDAPAEDDHDNAERPRSSVSFQDMEKDGVDADVEGDGDGEEHKEEGEMEGEEEEEEGNGLDESGDDDDKDGKDKVTPESKDDANRGVFFDDDEIRNIEIDIIDETISVREFLLLLKKSGLMKSDGALRPSHVVSLLQSMNGGEYESNVMEGELTFVEFLEACRMCMQHIHGDLETEHVKTFLSQFLAQGIHQE